MKLYYATETCSLSPHIFASEAGIFIAAELHKMFSPWLFHPEYGPQVQDIARGEFAGRLAFLERHLAANGPFVLGERITAADAYLFTIASWSAYAKVDLSAFPHVRDFIDRVGTRPAVREAMRAEGLKVAA